MAKYEIMLILDPKEELDTVKKMVNDIFGEGLQKFTKMDKTELAYPINKSNTAQYILINADTTGEEIKELTRRVNITKSIWRQLAINLDTERAVDSLKNMKKFEEFKARKAAERSARESGRPPRDSRPRPTYTKREN